MLDEPRSEFGTLSAAIRGVVFDDRDADGVRDAGEPGRSGVTVRLHPVLAGGDEDEEIAVATTNNEGEYAFADLPAGRNVGGEGNVADRHAFPDPRVDEDAHGIDADAQVECDVGGEINVAAQLDAPAEKLGKPAA